MSQSEKDGCERGVVKWFNDAKGFGFITHTSGKDVFVHYSVIISDGFKTLKDGEIVEYEIIEGDKGYSAKRVSRIDAPEEGDVTLSTISSKVELEIIENNQEELNIIELDIQEQEFKEIAANEFSLSSV